MLELSAPFREACLVLQLGVEIIETSCTERKFVLKITRAFLGKGHVFDLLSIHQCQVGMICSENCPFAAGYFHGYIDRKSSLRRKFRKPLQRYLVVY